MNEPILSLVTGTRNREFGLRRLLISIQQHTKVDWEFLVADASDQPIRTDDLPENVIVIPERPRLGHSKGYNIAFRQTRGEWVLWLNDDAEVMPGYAETAIQFMQLHPRIGLGALPYSNRGNEFRVNWYHDMVYANFGILNRELGNAIGWFDEDLRMYGSDNAIAFRVLLAGYGVAAVPGAYIIHHEDADTERDLNQFDRYPEADRLNQKYGPYLDQMKATYAQYAY